MTPEPLHASLLSGMVPQASAWQIASAVEDIVARLGAPRDAPTVQQVRSELPPEFRLPRVDG
jgi:hypothetical protein